MILALYTTIYPGVEKFLFDWYQSVLHQTDQDFQLWIGLDSLDVDSVKRAIGVDPKAQWITVHPGATPAQIRQKALVEVLNTCDGVVLVDSDDLLQTSRVAAARAALQTSDVAGCALALVDVYGAALDVSLGLPVGSDPASVLPRHNVFGLSNSAFRCDMLQRCLPIPDNVDLIDWFLASRAWLLGARMNFDSCVHMNYRQHGANLARVRGPFTTSQVVQDTARVRKHFGIMRTNLPENYLQEQLSEFERTADDVELFYERVTLDPDRLAGYVAAFNDLALPPLWWSCVAYPALKHFWHPLHN
jgi:hypothetical protein